MQERRGAEDPNATIDGGAAKETHAQRIIDAFHLFIISHPLWHQNSDLSIGFFRATGNNRLVLFFHISMRLPSSLAVVVLLAACTPASTDTTSNSLVIKGSDTEVQLVSNLAETFAETNTNLDISVTGGGSATGIASLLNGEVDVANSSRPLSAEERAQATQLGLSVVEFILARDGLSVIVHPDNPIESLTIAQVARLYSGDVTEWSAVGRPSESVVLYGRQSTSGTFGFFRDTVVKDDYSPEMRNMEGSQAIVEAVKSDPNGIGYVGVGYVKGEDGSARGDIKIIPIAADADSESVSPLDRAAVLAGRYPISRPIYQYLPSTPEAGSAVEAFLRFESSEEGQIIVEEAGFYPVTEQDAAANRAAVPTLE